MSISETTRQRVLEAAKSLNYHPDVTGRKLVSGKSYTLGLVLKQSSEQVFADSFLIQVLLGVEQVAIQYGFHVLLKLVAPDDATGYIRLINENHVDGIILSGPRQDDVEIIELHRKNIPVMLIGQLPGSDIPFVDVDAEADVQNAIEHLIESGHKRIAMITNARLTYTSAQQRKTGYLNALKVAGLPTDDALIKEGDFTPESGYIAMKELLAASPRPTAVFVASDIVAMGAVQVIKQAGLRIPQEIAVVGFDGLPLSAYFDPPLSTVHLPAYGLGWAAGERLIRLIKEEGLDQTGVLMKSELIVRASSSNS